MKRRETKTHICKTLSAINPALCGRKGKYGVELSYALQQDKLFGLLSERFCKNCVQKMKKMKTLTDNQIAQRESEINIKEQKLIDDFMENWKDFYREVAAVTQICIGCRLDRISRLLSLMMLKLLNEYSCRTGKALESSDL